MRIGLIGTVGRRVHLHAHCDADEEAGGEIPKDNGSWQSDDISNALGEVEKKEDIAQETADERGYIDVVAPGDVSVSRSHLVVLRRNSKILSYLYRLTVHSTMLREFATSL